METKKVFVDGKEIEIVTKLDDGFKESNDFYYDDEDTLDLSKVVEDINSKDSDYNE